ncbi:MAG: hypothetical protein NUV46_00940 [Nanoarchaeota archaeon]|nr:hypothetical protein [Nanoarchaeota archaeon]
MEEIETKPGGMQSQKEKNIRKITQFYYSRSDVQDSIFKFSKNREISPRYFEGFGKRPDTLQFRGDVLGLAKRGATSFHCSEELWKDPLKIKTGMDKKDADELRVGWDLLIDIDCEHGIKYSKLAAESIVESFNQHGIKNVGIKFSGSKGFHILLPWKSFPKNINGLETKDLFPELPRSLVLYMKNYSASILKSKLDVDFEKDFAKSLKTGFICKKCRNFSQEYRNVEFRCEKCQIFEIRKFRMGTRGSLPKCYKCKNELKFKPLDKFLECERCDLNSIKNPENFTREEKDLYSLMGLDLVLVSPRHLFRMPYSLHEKSALVSVVLSYEELKNFKLSDADPLRIKIKDFMPPSEENESAEFVMQALDWIKSAGLDKDYEKKAEGKYQNYKSVKLENLKDSEFPPVILKILEGVGDGKKRAVFALINFFRSIGMEKEELEKRIYEWNDKNEVPLKKGYIGSQLEWSYKRKPLMPPNFSSEFYNGLGAVPNQEEIRLKNPVNYTVRKNFLENKNK